MLKILTIAILMVILFLSGCTSYSGQTTYIPKSPVYKTIRTPIVDDTIVIEPNQYLYYKFSIPESVNIAELKGQFSTVGGSGNDIEVYIMSSDDFINWKNGHESRVYYQSGKKTIDSSINFNLPSGTYYLIYSNTFSLISNKAVKTNFFFTYNVCVQYCN